jgi:FkbM family methyltransferase
MKEQRTRTEDLIPLKPVSTKHGEILFYCAGRVCLYRADTFHTKEPETLEWIDSFNPGDVMWDIGANVGVYSLYAALRPIQVLAFEPSAFNYFILMKNIHVNEMDQRISALCLPFSNSNELASFNMNYLEVGDSFHQIGGFDSTGAQLRQAVLTLTIDDFVRNFKPPFPTHIKIDVDGVESLIIQGGMKTISDPRMKSLLIEIDENEPKDANIVKMLKFAGLEIKSRKNAMHDGSSTMWNCVFHRKDQ